MMHTGDRDGAQSAEPGPSTCCLSQSRRDSQRQSATENATHTTRLDVYAVMWHPDSVVTQGSSHYLAVRRQEADTSCFEL